MILQCSCQHKGQDKIHGKYKRVHNPVKGPNNTTTWRCTVCEKEQSGK